jgi:hypothetical protein
MILGVPGEEPLTVVWLFYTPLLLAPSRCARLRRVVGYGSQPTPIAYIVSESFLELSIPELHSV